jgi:hypothetical protein
MTRGPAYETMTAISPVTRADAEKSCMMDFK